jgi:hypothetical protein
MRIKLFLFLSLYVGLMFSGVIPASSTQERIGGARGVTINATNGALPYRSSSTAFSDSPLTRTSASVVTSTASLLFSTDNTLDLGAAGATRPRTGYFGTSVVSKHFVGSGTTPTCAVGNATVVGTGATCSVTGNDSFGEVTLNAGTGMAGTGNLVTLTFSSTYAAAPACVTVPSTSTTADLFAGNGQAGAMYVGTSATTFTIFNTDATIPPNATYKWMYHCGGL